MGSVRTHVCVEVEWKWLGNLPHDPDARTEAVEHYLRGAATDFLRYVEDNNADLADIEILGAGSLS